MAQGKWSGKYMNPEDGWRTSAMEKADGYKNSDNGWIERVAQMFGGFGYSPLPFSQDRIENSNSGRGVLTPLFVAAGIVAAGSAVVTSAPAREIAGAVGAAFLITAAVRYIKKPQP